ncbi:ribonuclease HI family protein [bacterium]|nr:ribonuclease HI family protein [bacterium]MCK4325849.1 ribonuclease HI family protein [bacterium]MCK4436739.1 ribonuclease HI family protein [bacterium]
MSDGGMSIYVDGACRGNPGKAAVGIIIFDDKKNVVRRRKEYLGRTTNNVAEYMALIYGLQEGLISRAGSLTIYTDSELAVKQLEGKYRIKDELLKILSKQVEHLREGFEEVNIKYLNRKENKEADRLANQAIDMAL